MPTVSGDLVQTLIEGGLSANAAQTLANAIGNAATATLSQGRDATDATPRRKLRLITRDSRKYDLTNLDYSPTVPFQQRISSNPGRYAGEGRDHPYRDSQPVTTNSPLSEPRVQSGRYIDVENNVESNAAVSKISLSISKQTGRHLRIDPSTTLLEALPILANTETPRFLSASVDETPEGTELTINLRNLQKKTIRLSDNTVQDVYGFFDGSPSPGPAPADSRLVAFAAFDMSAQQSIRTFNAVYTAEGAASLGAFRITFTQTLPNNAYCVVCNQHYAQPNHFGTGMSLFATNMTASYFTGGFAYHAHDANQGAINTAYNPLYVALAVYQ